jgi:hypothetical protein
LAPYHPGWPTELNPRDPRFTGSPVDFVVFDGLNKGGEITLFVTDVKTGASALNGNQRRIRDAVNAGRVRWFEVRLDIAGRTTEAAYQPELTEKSMGDGELELPARATDSESRMGCLNGAPQAP